MTVAILKPDHLGDLVLSAPAIAALERRFDDLILLCQPSTRLLAAHLFPRLSLRTIQLPYLAKEPASMQVPADVCDLGELRGEVDLLVSLRWDRYLEPLLEASGLDFCASRLDRLDVHVAAEDCAVVESFTGVYDPLESFCHPANPLQGRPPVPERVGLCISAGFVRNAWPLSHWLELAKRFDRQGSEVVLIGGPSERVRLRVLEDALADSVGYRPRRLVGSSDFGAFLEALATSVDLVIGTDSGTAHLASLVRPVVSLFGGSPWRRYAPLGRNNLVLSREEPCSPCVQFNLTRVQTCHTQECLALLSPEQVHRCVMTYLARECIPPIQRLDGVLMAHAPWEGEVPTLAAR